MSGDAYDALLAKLPSLTPAQLRTLRTRASALLQFDEKPEQPAATLLRDDWLLDGILQVLRDKGLTLSIPPLPQLIKLQQYKTYEHQSVPVRAVLEKAVPGITRAEKQLLGVLSARSLARHLKGWSEVSLRTMLRYVAQVPEALERSYPGYIEAGVLHAILRMRNK